MVIDAYQCMNGIVLLHIILEKLAQILLTELVP